MNYNERIRIITVGIVSIVLGTMLTVGLTIMNYNNYIISNNAAILRVVNVVLESEELTKDEIVKALDEVQNSDAENLDINIDILADYGYKIDTQYFLDASEVDLLKNIAVNLIVVDGFILLIIGAVYICEKRRNNRIVELIYYLQELNNKNYSLKIEQSAEDELSKLKNELYQITVFLKEQAETSLMEKRQVKQNIVDISHQLKTPITSMTIMLDNILDYPDMDEQTKTAFLEDIRGRVLHMEFLLRNLLKLSKFDANVILFKEDKVDVKALIEDATKNLQTIIDEKRIVIEIKGDDNAYFHGDFKWQSEALANIIKNAVEHSYVDGRIQIEYSMTHFHSKISIQDYGTGIKKENIRNIFTRFYKDEYSSEESVGVGLSLAKMIVEKGNGTIKVSSKEGQGTTFELRYMRA